MKREDLKTLGLEDAAIDAVMKLHGTDIEKFKGDVTTLTGERDALKTQLTEAGTTIESFKALKPDELKAAADDWKAKAEQAALDATKQVEQLKFNHALESALASAKAKSVKAVQALIDTESLTLNKDGSLHGLDKQLEKIKSENDFLFDSESKVPGFVSGGGQTPPIANISALEAAINKGGGFKSAEGK